MHKFITIPHKKKSVIPYLDTTVDFSKSFGEIQGMLMKFGCSDLITRQTPDKVPGTNLSCTRYSIAFVQKGNKFLIEFPIVIVPVGQRGEKQVRDNVSGRIILNKVKAMLVDVEMEYLSFEQAMMPFQLICDRDGALKTIQDFVDDHRNEIDSGQAAPFLLGERKK